MTGTFDPTFVLINRLEAALWITIALAMALAATRRSGAVRVDCIAASLAFALFCVSDIVETTTGAWWRPWWLLAWKSACVLAFLVLLVRHVKRTRRPA